DLDNFSRKDQMLYLLGRAYEEDKQFKKALSIFNQVIEKFSDSKWINKSYFRKSRILTKKKQFPKAYSILKSQLLRLLQRDRRSKYSKIYLNLAKEISFIKDKKLKGRNDYKKALVYYQKAVEIGSLKENEDFAQYRIALCYYKLKKYRQSKRLLEEFLRKYPESGFLEETHFYLGKVEHQLGDPYKSRTHYLKVLKKKESKDQDENLSPKTLYYLGKSYGLANPRSEEQLDLGIQYWRQLIKRFPKHKLAAQSAYEIGLSYNHFHHLKKEAVQEFLNFIHLYPNSKNAPLALESIGIIHLDQNQFDKSLDYYQQFLKTYPNHRSWQSVQRQIINVKYQKGQYLFKLKKYRETRKVFQAFLKEYPIEPRNAEIMYLLGEISYIQKDYTEAIKKWEKLHSKYPDNVMAHKALYSIAKIYLDKKFDFEMGVEILKKVKSNPWYRKAQNKIQTLNRKSLSLATRKLFFSTEKPTVHIQTRNIENYRINIYRLDLKEYNNRHQILSDIEQLDILLIKPDTMFDKKVEGYQKHKLFKQDLHLHIKEPGAYIISISSDTLKASTLLIISDLGVFVQANKRELLVFAKNLRKETGEPKAKVYVGNGKKVILEGECDERGFFYYQFPRKYKVNINQLTVLLEKDGHYAGSGLSTKNFSSYDKTEYSGYIYSDKPVYKPGDRLSYKGILRVLQKGVLKRIKQNQMKVTFSSPSGKKIYEKKVKYSSYGTVNGSLVLPKTISTGWAKLRIEGIKNKEILFEKSFEIAQYTKPEKEILFETDKVAYFPRDKVKLKFIAKHLFGLPASGKTLFYKIDRDSYKSAKLNENGELDLTIDTVKYGQKSAIRIHAYLEGGKKTFTKSVPIIIRDFSISLHPQKTIYLGDEVAEITVTTLNHLLRGLSKSLKARLYLMKDDQKNLMSEQDFETDANGEGKVSFAFKEGGTYYIYVEGVGQNKIPVRKTVYFRVLKKEEKSKLFLLSENKPFKLGNPSNIVLYSQGITGLALVTIKGESIISHRTIKVESEKTLIPFEIDKRFVPNFKLSVTLMKRDRIHHTEKQFQVDSGIRVKMETNKKVYNPGETIILKLKTHDVMGKGISAESSVVLIDEGVLLLTGTRLSDIKSYFHRLRHYPSHSESGSTPYKYLSVTQKR
ncbi:MAG TPA: tetratricopeptide repeat protein, partial [Spirochaetes bacterium]|nr:tetratricopeptide repeat protein [Spirochaetota bacterium]